MLAGAIYQGGIEGISSLRQRKSQPASVILQAVLCIIWFIMSFPSLFVSSRWGFIHFSFMLLLFIYIVIFNVVLTVVVQVCVVNDQASGSVSEKMAISGKYS